MKKWWWLLFWIYVAVLFFLTSYPKIETPDLGFNAQDKLYHLVAYFLFTVLLTRAMVTIIDGRVDLKLKKVFLWSIGYAVFDELHQFFIPGRSCSAGDVLANILGILIGGLLFGWLYKRSKSLNQVSFLE